MKNSEGNYSMNSNPGEDQWGQFGFDGAPEPENQESLQEKQAERGAKTIETVKSELEQKLKSLEEAYQNASETDKAGIAQEYASIYQELANVERGAGINAEKSQTGEEEKRNSVVEKLHNNKGATNHKTVLAMTALGGLLGLTAVMNILGTISNSGLFKAKEKAPEEPKQQTEADTNNIETSVEDNEQLKTYDEWLKADNEEAQARYDKMNRLLDGKIFNGEKLPGMWDDDVSKNAEMSRTGRRVDNDLMTSQVVYNMICEDPSNPTLEEERMVSLSGTLAEPEKALLLLRDTLKVPEFQGMSNDEGVAYLKGLSEDSAEFKSYTDKIVDFHTNSEVRVESNIDVENEILAKIPEEYRPEAKKWLEEHIYVNRQTGKIEAMVLPTGDDEQVLVWEYKDEKGEARIAMEIKKCRNYFVITITPDGKIEISADEGTPSGGDENPGSAGDENPDSAGNENPDSVGNENPDSVGNENPDSVGNENPDSVGNENPDSVGNENPDSAGSEHTPKDPDVLNDPDRKGDGDPLELDVDVTPPTTEEQDKDNLDDLKKREEEEQKKKEEEKKIKKDQEEAEKQAKEEAEKRKKEEEERKKNEEEEKKADEAKKKAEEEAKKEQERRAEEERKRREEEEARKRAQDEADQREKENREEAENNSNAGSDDRQNIFENGDF